MSDTVTTLGFPFLRRGEMSCADAVDSNDDGMVDMSDTLATLGFLILGTIRPISPGPVTCGLDPSPDLLPDCAYPLRVCAE